MGNIQIIKWNIYLADVPFIDDFKVSKVRPVIIINNWADNVTIIPLTTILHKGMYDIVLEINDTTSLAKITSLQTIHIKNIIKPFMNLNSLTNERTYNFLPSNKRVEIKQKLCAYMILESEKNLKLKI